MFVNVQAQFARLLASIHDNGRDLDPPLQTQLETAVEAMNKDR